MTTISEPPASGDFESGQYMTRRLGRAWQLKVPSSYLAPGANRHKLMPEGTWVVENLKTPTRGRPTNEEACVIDSADRKVHENSQSESAAHRHVRWPVSAELFPKKYRHLKGNVYLNIETIHLQDVESHRKANADCYSERDGFLYLNTHEAPQRVDGQHVIATGQSRLGNNSPDYWPIDRRRVIRKEYRPATIYNRALMSLTPWRIRHMFLRVLGMAISALAATGAITGMIIVANRESVLPEVDSPTLARCLALLLLLLPAVCRWTLALGFPKSRSPTALSLLMMTAGSVLAFSILIGLRIGTGPIHSLQTAMRQLTGGSYDQILTGSLESLAQSTSFLGTLIVTLSFIMIGRQVFRQAWDLALTRILTFDLIVIGLGTSTIRLLQDIRSSSVLKDFTKRIVIVDNSPGNVNAPMARSLGAFVLFGELDPRLLRRLATSPARTRWGIRYRWKTQFVLAYTADDVTNLRVAELVDRLRDPETKPRVIADNHVAVSIRVQDLWTQERYRESPMTRTDTKTQLTVINSFDTCASEAIELLRVRELSEQSLDLTRPIILVGYSQLAIAIVRRLRQEFLMTVRLQSSNDEDSSRKGWNKVHWIVPPGAVHNGQTLLPSDVVWMEDGTRSVSRFSVVIHDEEQIDARQLILKADPAVLMFFGRNAITDWVRSTPIQDLDGSETAATVCVECLPSERYQFDHAGGCWDGNLIRGPHPLVPGDGLVSPGYHLYGHVGMLAELTHTSYSLGKEQQQWRSEFLNPIHRESSFNAVQLVLQEFDKRDYVLQRVSGVDRTDIEEDVWMEIAQAEHERWREERSRLERGRQDVEHWVDASKEDQEGTRERVELVQEGLFMIGLDFVERRRLADNGTTS